MQGRVAPDQEQGSLLRRVRADAAPVPARAPPPHTFGYREARKESWRRRQEAVRSPSEIVMVPTLTKLRPLHT